MLSIEPILTHAPVFLAAMFRVMGIFVLAPGLAGETVPRQVKILFAVALTAVVYPTINLDANLPLRFDLVALAPVLLTEVIIGFTIGLILSMPMIDRKSVV